MLSDATARIYSEPHVGVVLVPWMERTKEIACVETAAWKGLISAGRAHLARSRQYNTSHKYCRLLGEKDWNGRQPEMMITRFRHPPSLLA